MLTRSMKREREEMDEIFLDRFEFFPTPEVNLRSGTDIFRKLIEWTSRLNEEEAKDPQPPESPFPDEIGIDLFRVDPEW